MGVGSRLKEARKQKGLTQQEFAENLGFKWHKIKDLESEKLVLSAQIAESIENIYSIDGWWLLTGNGSMVESKGKTTTKDGYIIDVLNVKAGAGNGVYNYEVEVVDTLILDRHFFKIPPNPDKIKIIEVAGDSMEPTLRDGSLVVVDESKQDKTDGIYAINIDGQLLIKRLQFNLDSSVDIISDNPKYKQQNYNPIDTQIPLSILGRKVLTIQ